MAISALCSETLLMHIIRLVAGVAVDLGLLEPPAQVTGLAGSSAVYADEGEAGQIVLEEHTHVSAILVVAIGTVLALLPLMRIDRPMAVEADGVSQSIHRGGAMAGVADEILM